MKQLIIFTENQSPRFDYVVSFLMKTILGIDFLVTNNQIEFIESAHVRFNYSTLDLASDFQMIPNGLLLKSSIERQHIEMETWNERPCFFRTSTGEIPFDLFSAAFYLVSRYEEYLPFEADRFGRFPVENSLAFKDGFLSQPLVDYWMQDLRQMFLLKSPDLNFITPQFKFVPTYDIDIAYSYLGKGFLRNSLGMAKDLLHTRFQKVIERARVLMTKQTDPYDSYQFLNKLHEKFKLAPIYFFLVSDGGPLDKNLDPTSQQMQHLIEQVKSKYQVGIHPSYSSHKSKIILKKEVDRLGSKVSRQHYIKFTLPNTYQTLISLDITDDYSMGYGSQNGFRASTSFPHAWFDLTKNEVTSLILHPFCFMECNSFFMQHFKPEEALQELMSYTNHVEKVGGQLITIWHNFSLGNDELWKGWKEIYANHLEAVTKL